MPPAPFCLPGPHDVHNAGSVKLAEATRIRLILPGLNTTPVKEPQAAGSGKQTGRAAGVQIRPAEMSTSPAAVWQESLYASLMHFWYLHRA